MTYHQPPQQQPIYVQGPRTSGLAVASLIFGIGGILLGCCTFGIPSVVAVLLGHSALPETKSGAKSGHGMAIAGLILGYVFVIPMILLSIQMVLGAGISAFQNP